MKALRIYRILYKILYVTLGICLLGLLIITPADAIHQAFVNNQNYNIWMIVGAYAITVVFAVTVYSGRIWTSKKVIEAIPKTYIPIEKGEVKEKVRLMIMDSLTRSAAIAWNARPRIDSMDDVAIPIISTSVTTGLKLESKAPIIKLESSQKDRKKDRTVLHKWRSETGKDQTDKDEETVSLQPEVPVWGVIEHRGWSSPVSPNLPNLQYITVILELPHLIEAKAVSLAPPDPESATTSPIPDIRAVGVLQRPASMGLRDYLTHLTSVQVIASPPVAEDFLAAYEYARFSSQPLTETEFRELMKNFAELIRGMQPLTPAILASLDIDTQESEIDDDNSSSTTSSTHRSRSLASSHAASSRSGSEGTIRTAPSRRADTSGTSTTRRFPEFSTAPVTPSRKRVISRTPSANSFAQSRRSYNGSSGTSSSLSITSSQGSVIRLRANDEVEAGELPYILTIPRAR